MTLRTVLERLLSLLSRQKRKYRGLRGAGQEWEKLAERHLEKAGYRIRARNVRMKAGEIDLIAEEKGVLCFIEVKGRRGFGFGLPEEAVTLEKQRRISRAAEEYIQRKRLENAVCRFDVVSILAAEPEPRVEILRDAFRGPLPPRPRHRNVLK
ncbi:MAG TPA: YraN family protein [Thermoanaerobaculia bacterium]|nr:YraN family protein [Thermoanaerobaculia bacterium]